MTIQLGGWTLVILLMAFGAYVGWRQGIRAFLTITMVSALSYIFLVSGVSQLLDYMNNIYVNIPKLIAIFTGGNPDAAVAWNPILPTVTLPLIVRFVLFVALVLLSWFFNSWPNWYKKGPAGDPLSRQLGAFSGALTALIWTSAISTFWQQSIPQGGQQGDLANMISSIPDVTPIAPWLITLFFLIVVVSVVLNIPKLWKA